MRSAATLALAGAALFPTVGAAQGWTHYGGGPASQRSSALDQIDRANVDRLSLVWEWRVEDGALPPDETDERIEAGRFEATPIAFGDTLFLTTPLNRLVALDAGTGNLLWEFDPEAARFGAVPGGFVHRGVAAWSDGTERRVFLNSRWRLYAIDAATGRPIEGFGDGGEIDITASMSRRVEPLHLNATSPPIVAGDLVVVGSSIADHLVYPDPPPGDVLAFDVRDGSPAWRFETTPVRGEPGWETWEGGLEHPAGHTNVWAPMSLDADRGLLYLPVSSPTNDWYGGDRPGDNLYSSALVCLDAATGRLRWYFQTVRHGVWDYDLPAAPNLITISPDDRDPVDAVAVVGKTGFTYVFDRVTGEPVWPIVDRAVPASTVPGERTAATQPIPTRPRPFARQGFGEGDIIALTPEIERGARAALEGLATGPVFTPPSLDGTVVMPGWLGGATWAGASFDPASGTLYVGSNSLPTLGKLVEPPDTEESAGAAYVLELPPTLEWTPRRGPLRRLWDAARRRSPPPPLPVIGPPYATLTAIDMSSGEHRWQRPLGDRRDVREHPLLRDLDLPPLGAERFTGSIVTAGGLLFIGADDELLAIDKDTGETLWTTSLGRRANGTPMTVRTSDGRQLVVIATGGGDSARLLAFALPEIPPAGAGQGDGSP